MNKLLNVAEAADLLNLAPQTIRNKVHQRKIPFIKLGGKVLFKPEELSAWVEEHAVKAIE
ncbi:helix-turn-helix domain-containing protein [Marispirochaeta aestuarii]|uniref:helix-turn-helix domain-containing protein n=1 Tax=Marispirochaeta aestuarii TaxID=1963862 RepID=UPI0029C70A3E|nr:helix-turn-helix domain-containing protein [Marispirochaeta aestuarii]